MTNEDYQAAQKAYEEGILEVGREHYDYDHQAWVVDGRYIRCGHPEAMECGCYGRAHAGELADSQPPIAAEADREYTTRIQAAQVSWQFTDVLRPRKPQASVDDLPLFGGERQEEMF